jgi:peptidoglycan/LPS O-acetylase OafA/YrhL
VDKNNSRLEGLQSLRGIAALGVLLFHVRGYMWIVANNHTTVFEIFTGVFGLGAVLFFAISGFLMAHLIETGYRNFLVRRAARIYPSFFVAVAISLFAQVLFLDTVTQPKLAESLTLLPLGVIPYPLHIEWTLIYEVFFYVVCSVFTIGKAKRAFPYFLVAWLIGVLIAHHVFDLPKVITPTVSTVFFQFFNMFFIVGALTYYVHRKVSLSAVTARAMLGAIGVVVIAWPFLERIHLFAQQELYAFALCCVGILLATLAIGSDTPKHFAARLLHRAGDYSYGIYLMHASVLWIVFTVCVKHFGALDSRFAFLGLGVALLAGIGMGMIDVKIHATVAAWLRSRSVTVPAISSESYSSLSPTVPQRRPASEAQIR